MNTPTIDTVALEPWVRSCIFIASIVAVTVAERLRPRRPSRPVGGLIANVALLLTNTLIVRVATTTSLIGLAVAAQAMQWGLLTRIAAPDWIEIATAVLLLDASMYLQHRLFHWVPWLWRLHAVHHSDTAFDVTTGIRFHPGEILVSLALKAVVVVAVGVSPSAVLVFEVLLSCASLFAHANLRLGPRHDLMLRKLLVTPEVHRIHHSVERDEHNSNFGFMLLWWDRLFGTYRATPRHDPRTMAIGLPRLRTNASQRFGSLLMQPFLSQ